MATVQERDGARGTTWRTVWRDTDTGKVRSRTFTDPENAEALKEFLDSNNNSFKVASEAKRTYDKRIPRVHEIVTRHIDLLTKPQPGTITRYRNHNRDHIVDSRLGKMAVDRVEKKHVIEWLGQLKSAKGSNIAPGSELSQRTKKNVQALLSSAFNTAVEEGAMLRNPAKGIGDPDLNQGREAVYLSPEDLEIIEDATPDEYRLFVKFLGKTGLRYNEATALRKRDIRVEGKRCIVMVTRAWKNTGAGEEIGTPKTAMARRNVTCGLELSAELIDHMNDLRPGELVFSRPGGEFLRNSYFHKNVWQPVINKLVKDGDLDDKPWIHELRKAHTTHLLQKGVAVNVVQARLGHEDPQTTLKIYARLTNDDDRNAADALD